LYWLYCRLEAYTCLGLREEIYRGLGVCSITGRARHGLLADGTRADLKRTVEDILLDRGLSRRQAQLVVVRSIAFVGQCHHWFLCASNTVA